MATACLILSAVLLLLSTHPFCSYPVSLLVARRFRNFTLAKTSIVSSENLSYAICVCAYNEEKVIVNKVLNLLELRSVFPGIQILVYVDAASDRTPELLEEYSDQINLVVSTERHGKTYGMNLLASMTQADIVMFSDANVMIDIESTRNLHQYFKNPEIGCVSANLRYQNAADSVTSEAGATYWKFEEWVKTLETACGGSMAADGALFAMRKSVYESPPAHIIDDFYLSLKVIIKGLQVVQAGNVIAYERSAVNSREEFVRKVRIGCQSFNIHRLLWPELKMLSSFTLYKYISHKLIRWLSGFLFIASCIFFELALILSEQYSFAITYVFMWSSMYVLGNVMGISPFSKIWELFSSLVATGVGVCKSLRGEVFQTWTPPASARSKSLRAATGEHGH